MPQTYSNCIKRQGSSEQLLPSVHFAQRYLSAGRNIICENSISISRLPFVLIRGATGGISPPGRWPFPLSRQPCRGSQKQRQNFSCSKGLFRRCALSSAEISISEFSLPSLLGSRRRILSYAGRMPRGKPRNDGLKCREEASKRFTVRHPAYPGSRLKAVSGNRQLNPGPDWQASSNRRRSRLRRFS